MLAGASARPGREVMSAPRISALFLDIGGVLLTNGWDRSSRRRACGEFGLDYEEVDERHHLTFGTYEEGRISLDTYLDRVVFYEERPFSREQFRAFMFAQSKPFPQMIDLVRGLKTRYGLKTAAVSNEGRELTLHRIREFALDTIIDVFVSSCFVHRRKPDDDVFELALDLSQSPRAEVVYIEDRALFADIARGLGIRSIQHTSYESTRAALEELGLRVEQ
jgi:putative hydrolase of the HAD superfamily